MPAATCALRIVGGLQRREFVVQVVVASLVLDERARVGQLADVVVVGGHADQQRIGADRLGCPLAEVADHQRVVVRARRLEQQPAQQRLRRIGQLEQLERGREAEDVAEQRERADRHDGRADGRRDAGAHELQGAGQVVLAEQAEDADDGDVDQGHERRRLDELLEPFTPTHGDHAGQRAQHDVDAELDRAADHRGQDADHG